jgi:DNA repair protein RadC
MTEARSSTIFRVRELELTYKPGRLHSPFAGNLTKSADAARLATDLLGDAAIETALVLHLNIRNKLIGTHRFPGTLHQVVLSVGDVCRAALLSNASGLILVHNHLSGDPTPRPDDDQLVQRLRGAAGLLDIQLLDALIVVDPSESRLYYSFRDSGLL